MHGRKTNASEPASTCPASRDRKSYASPSPTGLRVPFDRGELVPIERDAEWVGLGDAYDFLSREAGHVEAGSEGSVFLPCMQGAMAPGMERRRQEGYTG